MRVVHRRTLGCAYTSTYLKLSEGSKSCNSREVQVEKECHGRLGVGEGCQRVPRLT